jgi:glyoxylate carboligase
MTSGGLGTMGYGLPAAIGTQIGNPDGLVIDVAGEASILMNIQEMSTAAQYRLPVKIFILNNRWMGMVRQWQELLYAGRYSESYSESLPDFVKLADAFGAAGLRAERPAEVDGVIAEMLRTPGPVIVDCLVDRTRLALEGSDAPALVVSGGVAANLAIRTALQQIAADQGRQFSVPPGWLCTDNAAMIAWAGAERLARGLTDQLDAPARARWPLDPDAERVRGAGVKA